MRIVDKNSKKAFELFMNKDPIINTYIIGNYHKYGLKNANVIFYYSSKNESPYILMKYFDSFVFYTDTLLSNASLNGIIKFLSEQEYDALSGCEFSISQILPFLSLTDTKKNTIMTLNGKTQIITDCIAIKKLNLQDVELVYTLLTGIEEFKHKYYGETGYHRTVRLLSDDVVYGVIEDSILIGLVGVTAISKHSCMLVDICVHTSQRGKGVGSKLIATVAQTLFSQGIKNVNLYVNNPTAIQVYEKVGFLPVGTYMVLR